jgi:hypothetical protein
MNSMLGRVTIGKRARTGRWLAIGLTSLVLGLIAACGGAIDGNGASGSAEVPLSDTHATSTPSPEPPRVIVISIDGLRPDAVDLAPAPTLKSMMQRGATAVGARTVFPPITICAHASMVSGVEPSVHGMTWDDDDFEGWTIHVPTMFKIAQAAGLQVVIVAGKEALYYLAAEQDVDVFVASDISDSDVANRAIVEAKKGFDLMFVHFPDTDLVGHESGWLSSNQLATIRAVDAAINRLIAALPLNTTVIVTSDHGGSGRSHGRDIPEDMNILWLIVGPRVNAGLRLTAGVRAVDTAPTALRVLSLSLQTSSVVGRPVSDAFTDY